MKKLVIASGLCILLSGCIGFKWSSKIDDGAAMIRTSSFGCGKEKIRRPGLG